MQPHIEEMVGKELGGYWLDQVIGTGGTGVVFRATQITDGSTVVAIKILVIPWQATPDEREAFRARFRREGAILQQLHHPHIVPVAGLAESNGTLYMIMPYIAGGTLADRLQREGPQPLSRIATVLAELASALDYAHSLGVIHRDIKPGNILLDDYNQCLLSDFGIVRIFDSNATTLTMTGQVVGTPSYMAPEQATGQPVGPETDVYSLGMVVYEMMTGRSAFTGATPVEIMMHHRNDAVPLPRALRPDLPLAAEQVLLHALAKNPHDRFHTAGEFALAMHRALGVPGAVPLEFLQGAVTMTGPLPATPTFVTTTKDPTLVTRPPIMPLGSAGRPTGRSSSPMRTALSLGLALLVVATGLFVLLRHNAPPTASSTSSTQQGQVSQKGSSATVGQLGSTATVAGRGTVLPPLGTNPPTATVLPPTSTTGLGMPTPTPYPPTATTLPTFTPIVVPTATMPAPNTPVPPTATLVPPTAIPPTAIPPTPIPPTATPLPSPQLLQNAGFENGYTGWCVWNNSTNSLAGCNGPYDTFGIESSPGKPVDGTHYGYLWNPNADSDATLYQQVTAPQSGYYYVGVWGFGNGNLYSKQLYVRDNTAGTESTRTLINDTSGFSYFRAGPLYVPAGHLVEIEIRGDNAATYVLRVDAATLCFNYTATSCV